MPRQALKPNMLSCSALVGACSWGQSELDSLRLYGAPAPSSSARHVQRPGRDQRLPLGLGLEVGPDLNEAMAHR